MQIGNVTIYFCDVGAAGRRRHERYDGEVGGSGDVNLTSSDSHEKKQGIPNAVPSNVLIFVLLAPSRIGGTLLRNNGRCFKGIFRAALETPLEEASFVLSFESSALRRARR